MMTDTEFYFRKFLRELSFYFLLTILFLSIIYFNKIYSFLINLLS